MICCFWKSTVRIVVFEAADGWRFRGKAANNEIVFQSEAYTRKEDAERAAKMLCKARLRCDG